MAIPLALVARLEEFDRSTVEQSGGGEVVQYRGQIMPLISLNRLLHHRNESLSIEPAMHVVVYSSEGRRYGLVVDRILDIVQEALLVQDSHSRPGVIGSAVIQEKVTELLDLPGLVQLIEAQTETTALAA